MSAEPQSIVIGCAGFPVPATRYFKEFMFTELQDTQHAALGMGSIRRWRREAPPGFVFSMVAPRVIGEDGFRDGKICEAAVATLLEIGNELRSQTAVFVAPSEFADNRANKAAARSFLERVKPIFARVVWEAPASWNPDEGTDVALEAGVVPARDPYLYGTIKAKVAYYRLQGQAGHKSRYADHAIDKLAALAQAANHDEATYVFTNMDMFADAKRFKKALNLG